MADEDLLGTVDDLGDDEEDEEGQEGGSSLMKYLPLIGGLLVLQIVIAYFVANWWFVPAEPPPDAATEQVEEVLAEEVGQADLAPPAVTAIYEKLETIVVNPAGTDGLRFLSATIHLGVSSPDVATAIDENQLASKMNDRLIDILRSKTIGQLEPEYHDTIKAEMRFRLNEILGTKPGTQPPIVEIYFTGFVLQ
jgi:flagellar basal body-associated protein FliL